LPSPDFSILITAVIRPFSRSSFTSAPVFLTNFEAGNIFDHSIDGLVVSVFLSKATLREIRLPPPIKPNTRIKINGKAILKTTAEGLRKVARKLPFVMPSWPLAGCIPFSYCSGCGTNLSYYSPKAKK
jgi:hypothetical protein